MTNPSALDRLPATLRIVPWADPVVEAFGFGLRDPYVEEIIAAHVGPTGCLFLRRVGLGFALRPEGFSLDVAETAAALGIGSTLGRNGPWWLTLGRLIRFGFARQCGTDTLAVRRVVAPLPQRAVERLPASLQRAHGHAVAQLAGARRVAS